MGLLLGKQTGSYIWKARFEVQGGPSHDVLSHFNSEKLL